MTLFDHLAQLGIERGRIGYIRNDDRRGEQRDDLGGDAHAVTLHPNGDRGIERPARSRLEIESVDSAKPQPLAPNWGQKQAEDMLAQCK